MTHGMESLAKARARYAGQLEQALAFIVATLSSLDEVERISVFGSYARGRADLFTDLDVLVVMNSNEPFLERQGRLYRLLAVSVDLDLLCYTPQEFEALKTRPFLRQVLREEVVIYENRRAR